MDFDFVNEFIKPELIVLIPVLLCVGMGLKRSRYPDRLIPLTLGGAGILLAVLYVFSTCNCRNGVLAALFTGITQGILCAGASVYLHQLGKQRHR